MTIFKDILISYTAMPVWVQIWVGIILVPVHLAAILFVFQPEGLLLAFLAIGGMAPNLVLMFVERGFSRAMAISHVVLWTPMVVLIVRMMGDAHALSEGFLTYLWVLLPITVISLAFDFPDVWRWWKGARAVAGL